EGGGGAGNSHIKCVSKMKITRRTMLMGAVLAGGEVLGLGPLARIARGASGSIDRKSLVQRHNPSIAKFDPFSALTVGNGSFAFTADVTGLQTFYKECQSDFPLCTAAHWAWHTTPAPSGVEAKNYRFKMY